jgi:hypothetical protein
VGAANRRCGCFRKPEALHLARLDQVLDGSCHVFDRNLWIDAMLIEQVDAVGLEALQ